MGGCVSFSATEPPPSELSENYLAVQNPPMQDNQQVKAVSIPHIDVPFVPTRMLMNGSNESASTSIGTKGAHAMVYEFLLGGIDMVFCGLFDGHGPKGDLMSEKVRDNLPYKLLSEWRSLISEEKMEPRQDLSAPNVELDEAEMLPEIFKPLEQSFFNAFNAMDRELKEDKKVESFCSGTTALTVIKKGRDLLIGNLGKSRAILGTRDKNNNLIVEQLTIDLKPNLAMELDRIRRCKGRVFPTKEEPNMCRFFLPRNDGPGLSVSRAFGDFCLKDFGLIAVPQVSYHRLVRSDEFLILATDGVWDVLSNKEAGNIVASAPCKELAAKALIDHSVHAWSVKNPKQITDDISAIVFYLDMEHDGPDEEPEFVYYEKQVEQDQVYEPYVEIFEKEVINVKMDEELREGITRGEEVLGQEESKKKKGKSFMKMPKFMKKWGKHKKVESYHKNGESS